MYFGKASRSLFTDAKGKTDDLLHVQSAKKCVFHHPGKHCGVCLQEKGLCFSKQSSIFIITPSFPPFDKQSKQCNANAKLKQGFAEPLTFGAGLPLSTLMRHHKMQEVILILIPYTHNKRRSFSFISQPMRNGEKGNFPLKRICQHTKQRKEQQRVKQWALVFQHSTCPIIYTSVTGAILKPVRGGKLFVSKHLAHCEPTSAWVRVINDLWPHCVEVAN